MKRRGNGEGTAPRLRSDGRWQVDMRYLDENGIAHRISAYGKTATEARRSAKEKRRRLEQGRTPSDSRKALSSWITEWIDGGLAAGPQKSSTKATYAGLLRKHAAQRPIGETPLGRLRPNHIHTWSVELQKTVAASTARQCFIALRLCLDAAVKSDLLAVNPMHACQAPRAEQSDARYFTAAEAQAILSAAQGTRYEPVLRFLAWTGARQGEALALQWTDVDFERGFVSLTGTLTRENGALVRRSSKTRRSQRTLPMTAGLRDVLKLVQLQQKKDRLLLGGAWTDTGHVFTTVTGHPVDGRNILRALTAAAKKAGILGANVHAFRHSAASTMLEAGVSLPTVSRTLGHSSIQITGDVYSHTRPEVAAAAMETLSGATPPHD